jgi:hypothetical protein
MWSIDLGAAVSAAWLVLVGGMLLIFGLYGLSRRGAAAGPIRVRLGDDVLGGLVLALVFPAGIVAGFGHYILQANTGSYGTPDDFRNGGTFVNICWFFIVVVAPGFLLLGAAVLLRALWQALRRGK